MEVTLTLTLTLTVLGLAILGSLLLAYRQYTPLPPDLHERWLYRHHGAMHWLFKTLGAIHGRIKGTSPFVYHRHLSSRDTIVHPNFPELEAEEFQCDGVRVRLYKLKSVEEPAPCLVLIHGGGWVLNNIDVYDYTCVHLTKKTRFIVVSVDYRLAPEHPHPAAFEDCLKATKYVLRDGRRHGIDTKRVAVFGDSGGGTLATAVAMRLRDEGNATDLPPLKLQVLLYPFTQAVNFRTSSYRLYKNYPTLNQREVPSFISYYLLGHSNSKMLQTMMDNQHLSPGVRRPLYSKYFKSQYLPEYVRPNPDQELTDPQEDAVDAELAGKMDTLALDPIVSPLLAEDLSALPPAYVLVNEFDVLRDDGLLYVHRLKEAGVPVELSFAGNQPHGFMFMCPAPVFQFKAADGYWDKMSHYLKENL